MKLSHVLEAKYAQDPAAPAFVAVGYSDFDHGRLFTEFFIERDKHPRDVDIDGYDEVSRQEGIDQLQDAFFNGPVEPASHSDKTLQEHSQAIHAFEQHTWQGGKFYFRDWNDGSDEHDDAVLVFIPL
jgi:hypothetical protein